MLQKTALDFDSIYHRIGVLFTILLLCILSGFAYILTTKTIETFLGAVLLLIATAILVWSMLVVHRYIKNRGLVFFAHIRPSANFDELTKELNALHYSVFHTRNATVCGLLYGFVVSGAATLTDDSATHRRSAI